MDFCGFGLSKRGLGGCRPRTVYGLRTVCQEVWNAIQLPVLQWSLLHWTLRCRALYSVHHWEIRLICLLDIFVQDLRCGWCSFYYLLLKEYDKTSPIIEPHLQNNINRILRNWKLVFICLIVLIIIILTILLTVLFVRTSSHENLDSKPTNTPATTNGNSTSYRPVRTDQNSTATPYVPRRTDNSTVNNLTLFNLPDESNDNYTNSVYPSQTDENLTTHNPINPEDNTTEAIFKMHISGMNIYSTAHDTTTSSSKDETVETIVKIASLIPRVSVKTPNIDLHKSDNNRLETSSSLTRATEETSTETNSKMDTPSVTEITPTTNPYYTVDRLDITTEESSNKMTTDRPEDRSIKPNNTLTFVTPQTNDNGTGTALKEKKIKSRQDQMECCTVTVIDNSERSFFHTIKAIATAIFHSISRFLFSFF